MKCECPETGMASEEDIDLYVEEEYKGMSHLPNECLGDYQMGFWVRDGKTLWLCSCCCLSGDILLRDA